MATTGVTIDPAKPTAIWQSAMMRLALLSDTHLACDADDFIANARVVIDWINGQRTPRIAMAIHLGDVAADGAHQPEHLVAAQTVLAGLAMPLLSLPGNHDVGDGKGSSGAHDDPPVTDERLDRFRAVFGPDFWHQKLAGWSLIGLNAQLFANDSEIETAQWRWLEDQLRAVFGPMGLLLHKPLGLPDQPPTRDSGRYVPGPEVARLQALFTDCDLRFVISGHVHQQHRLHIDGVDHVWLPSTAFVIPERLQETIGQKGVGIAILDLAADKHRIEFVRPPGMRDFNLLDYADIYPQLNDLP